jgi:hypothetical protein
MVLVLDDPLTAYLPQTHRQTKIELHWLAGVIGAKALPMSGGERDVQTRCNADVREFEFWRLRHPPKK